MARSKPSSEAQEKAPPGRTAQPCQRRSTAEDRTGCHAEQMLGGSLGPEPGTGRQSLLRAEPVTRVHAVQDVARNLIQSVPRYRPSDPESSPQKRIRFAGMPVNSP